jgi:hypothetical protein
VILGDVIVLWCLRVSQLLRQSAAHPCRFALVLGVGHFDNLAVEPVLGAAASAKAIATALMGCGYHVYTAYDATYQEVHASANSFIGAVLAAPSDDDSIELVIYAAGRTHQRGDEVFLVTRHAPGQLSCSKTRTPQAVPVSGFENVMVLSLCRPGNNSQGPPMSTIL